MAEFERILASGKLEWAALIVIAYAAGIVAWFALPDRAQWIAFALGAAIVGLCVAVAPVGRMAFPQTKRFVTWVAIALALGCLAVWARSVVAGQMPIEHPMVTQVTGRILQIEDQPALDRSRIVLAARIASDDNPYRIRLNLPDEKARDGLAVGSVVRFKARLVPPAPPLLPGSYDFARAAWFQGLSATGSVLAVDAVVERAHEDVSLSGLRKRLARTVRDNLSPSQAGIAGALVTGDHGGIAETDAQAMRDSGLAHLLSISGLHVSAVVAATYFLSLRLLALLPWLALRIRLPVLAAGMGALAGVGYTLLTGSEVPTVRACIGALLVLIAVALGREALSLRMLAVAAFAVLALWPETIMGPSFQMSFSAVLALIALSTSGPVRKWLAPRDEGWLFGFGRKVALLFLTGLVIEFALMPIGLFHFHRAGAYGALANLLAIPLTTFIVMPLVALALLADGVGLAAPLWWMAGTAIDSLLGIAHWVSSRPGAVTTLPSMGGGAFLLFVSGGLWLALGHGHWRLLGLVPAAIGTLVLAAMSPPDLLVSDDGRQVAIVDAANDRIVSLRDSRSSYVRDNLREAAGVTSEPVLVEDMPGATCSPEFCSVKITGQDRSATLLLARGGDYVPERALAAACDQADIVVAARWLPWSCKPRWLKADRRMLGSTGGLAIDIDGRKVTSVAQSQGEHGWWRPYRDEQAR